MRNAGLEEIQAGIKIAGRNINNLRYADDTTLMAERCHKVHFIFLGFKITADGDCSQEMKRLLLPSSQSYYSSSSHVWI